MRTVGIDRVLFKVAESRVKKIGESLHDKNKVVYWSTIYCNINEEDDFLCSFNLVDNWNPLSDHRHLRPMGPPKTN